MSTSTEFASAYIRLRTLLDAVQANALNFCLDSEDVEVRMSRMSEVEAELMGLIGKLGGKGPCRPGYYNCGGVCVPYLCAEASIAGSAA